MLEVGNRGNPYLLIACPLSYLATHSSPIQSKKTATPLWHQCPGPLRDFFRGNIFGKKVHKCPSYSFETVPSTEAKNTRKFNLSAGHSLSKKEQYNLVEFCEASSRDMKILQQIDIQLDIFFLCQISTF
jgi:hypothetical protein